MRLRSFAILALVVGCHAPPNTPTGDREAQDPGKADALAGSCLEPADSCGTRSAGGCWCDAECVNYGDCCVDAAETCGVDECAPDTGCTEGFSCISDGDAFDCVDACSAPCPQGWRLAPNSAGLAFCIANDDVCALEGVTMPEGAEPYCHYVDDGYFGFYWEACAPGTEFQLGDDGEQRCVLTPEQVPVGAKPYCNYIEDGYFGFRWTLTDDPDYACPPETRFAPNGAGLGFCLASYDDMPGRVLPWCDPDAAYVGYEWNAQCE